MLIVTSIALFAALAQGAVQTKESAPQTKEGTAQAKETAELRDEKQQLYARASKAVKEGEFVQMGNERSLHK